MRLLPILLVGGCVAGGGSIGEETSNLYGSVTTASDCGSTAATLQDAARLGRIVARSNAFRECVDQVMRGPVDLSGYVAGTPTRSYGPYLQCDGASTQRGKDPFYGQSIDTQVAMLYAVTQSVNDVSILCDRTTSGGDANIGTYSLSGPEEMHINVDASWTPTMIASTIWHEAMHQHGYLHGFTDGDDAGSCGYEGQARYISGYSSAPYLVDHCIEYVTNRSQALCTAGCSGGAMSVVDGFKSSTCECVQDHHDPFSDTGYVCSVTPTPAAMDPKSGSSGSLYVSINSAPSCQGDPLDDGYFYSTGASYGGSRWKAGWLYSQTGLASLYKTLTRAARIGAKVRLDGTHEAPHYQLYGATLRADR
ncbi:MAG: hypothetical protein ACXVDD_08245 [Polyangia bacterium]